MHFFKKNQTNTLSFSLKFFYFYCDFPRKPNLHHHATFTYQTTATLKQIIQYQIKMTQDTGIKDKHICTVSQKINGSKKTQMRAAGEGKVVAEVQLLSLFTLLDGQ